MVGGAGGKGVDLTTLTTQLTDKLGIRHPVLLAPMDQIAGGLLAAAVSAAGGLGLIGGGYGDAEWLTKRSDLPPAGWENLIREISQQTSIPFIPDNAPFSPSQRAWLNGFLAGIFCQTPAMAGVPEPIAAVKPKLNVLFGSQSGNAESIANRIVSVAKKQGYDPTIAALEKTSPGRAASSKR